MIGLRALNRATLERQLLLRRMELPVAAAVGRLVGLQAQAVNAPYYGLWTRLAGFAKDDLTAALYDRRIVRSSVLRGTQHLVCADDFRWLRPLIQPIGDRGRQAAFGRATAGLDLAALKAAARELLRGRTLTRPELGRALAERFPSYDRSALAWSAQYLLPLVHEPPCGTWGRGGATPFRLAEEWVGPLEPDPSPAALARRYLAAFGPATVADLQAWSGLTRKAEGAELAAALASLELVVLVDEEGRELYDLPDAPRPDPDTPAPVRFLPEFDNLIVGHADRRRMMTAEQRARIITGSMVRATFLVDGFVAGMWELRAVDGSVELTLEEFTPLTGRVRDEVVEEASRLLAFGYPDSAHSVVFGEARRYAH